MKNEVGKRERQTTSSDMLTVLASLVVAAHHIPVWTPWPVHLKILPIIMRTSRSKAKNLAKSPKVRGPSDRHPVSTCTYLVNCEDLQEGAYVPEEFVSDEFTGCEQRFVFGAVRL